MTTMDGREVGGRRVAVRLALPAGTGLLGVGLAFGLAWLQAYGPGGGWAWVLGVPAFLLVLGSSAALFFGCTRALLGMAAALALFGCLGLAGEAAVQHALATRGRVAACVIDNAERRTVNDYEPGNGPNDPGHWTQRTDYVYRLRCTDGGPASMVTGSPAGEKGATIRVSWDPTGRVDPRPATDASGGEALLAALLVGAAVLLLALLDGVIDVVRYPRRPAWVRMPYFDELAGRWS
jgi:hypothetical protein